MTRQHLIEQLRRQVYGDFPADESTITDNLVNQYIVQGTAIAAKTNYKDNFQLEGVGIVNNSFYSTFKNIAVTKDEQFLYKFTLPSLALGIGSVDGISRIVFKDTDGKLSYPVVLLNENQVGYERSMRAVQGKTVCYPEGGDVFIKSTMDMTPYTASVTLISGGDASNLNSTVNIPDDYLPVLIQYVQQQLMIERNSPVKSQNDGADFVRTT